MKTVHLTTPISEEDVRSLEIGDVIYLTGNLCTGRDDVHARVAKQGRDCPVDLRGGAIFHAGPIVRKKEDGYEIVSVGPTTSMRMESYQREFIEKTGVRLIIGKGGMKENTERGCVEQGAVHAVFPGGCAVVAAGCVEKVVGVEWLDLGMPEAMWRLEVREFGPLIVSIDAFGKNLFKENIAVFNERKATAVKEISDTVAYLD